MILNLGSNETVPVSHTFEPGSVVSLITPWKKRICVIHVTDNENTFYSKTADMSLEYRDKKIRLTWHDVSMQHGGTYLITVTTNERSGIEDRAVQLDVKVIESENGLSMSKGEDEQQMLNNADIDDEENTTGVIGEDEKLLNFAGIDNDETTTLKNSESPLLQGEASFPNENDDEFKELDTLQNSDKKIFNTAANDEDVMDCLLLPGSNEPQTNTRQLATSSYNADQSQDSAIVDNHVKNKGKIIAVLTVAKLTPKSQEILALDESHETDIHDVTAGKSDAGDVAVSSSDDKSKGNAGRCGSDSALTHHDDNNGQIETNSAKQGELGYCEPRELVEASFPDENDDEFKELDTLQNSDKEIFNTAANEEDVVDRLILPGSNEPQTNTRQLATSSYSADQSQDSAIVDNHVKNKGKVIAVSTVAKPTLKHQEISKLDEKDNHDVTACKSDAGDVAVSSSDDKSEEDAVRLESNANIQQDLGQKHRPYRLPIGSKRTSNGHNSPSQTADGMMSLYQRACLVTISIGLLLINPVTGETTSYNVSTADFKVGSPQWLNIIGLPQMNQIKVHYSVNHDGSHTRGTICTVLLRHDSDTPNITNVFTDIFCEYDKDIGLSISWPNFSKENAGDYYISLLKDDKSTVSAHYIVRAVSDGDGNQTKPSAVDNNNYVSLLKNDQATTTMYNTITAFGDGDGDGGDGDGNQAKPREIDSNYIWGLIISLIVLALIIVCLIVAVVVGIVCARSFLRKFVKSKNYSMSDPNRDVERAAAGQDERNHEQEHHLQAETDVADVEEDGASNASEDLDVYQDCYETLSQISEEASLEIFDGGGN